MKYKAVEFSILLERIKDTAQIINLKILIRLLLILFAHRFNHF